MFPENLMRKNGHSMGRDNGSRSSAPRKRGNSLWAGIFAGTVIGVGLAAGVAWYLMKSPSPFTKREQPALAKPQPDTSKPAVPAATDKPATTTGNGKPRFEFYNVLTNKHNSNVTAPAKSAEKVRPETPNNASNKAAPAFEPQILQAGSFPNVSDAEKLKAKLALLGVEANIQTATIPDKGVWYRVRLGPYKSADEISRASSFLKQNGVDSTPMRAQ